MQSPQHRPSKKDKLNQAWAPSGPPNCLQGAPAAPARGRAIAFGLSLMLALLLALGAGLSGCSAIDEQQRRWIFQPSDRSWRGASMLGEGTEEVWIGFPAGQPEAARSVEAPLPEPALAALSPRMNTGTAPVEAAESIRLHGLWMPQSRADAPVMLYLHGARWDVRSSAHRMRRMHELGFAVLGVDYRGFGKSSPGLPSEALTQEDARAAWQWLTAQHPQAQRYLFGHSLGGAIAVQLAALLSTQAAAHPAEQATASPSPATSLAPGAALAPVTGLIVEGSFTSIPDVFSSLKWGWLPLRPFITQRLDAGALIDQVKAPVLVVHGSQDSLIKPELGRALYERAREPKRFVLVEGGSHHSTNAVGQSQYRQALDELFGLRPLTLR